MKTKYFETHKEACDYCAAANVSNECVEYDPQTNRYLIDVTKSDVDAEDEEDAGPSGTRRANQLRAQEEDRLTEKYGVDYE